MTTRAGDAAPLSTLAALFAEADDPVVVTDGRTAGDDGPPIVLANAAMARVTGRTVAELTGCGCLTLLDAITDPATRERVAAALESDTHLRADVWTRRASGLPCPSRWELLPLRDADGRVTHRVIIVHDLTAERLAEQRLADLEAAARRAGHDLNNMITGLIVNLSLLNGPGYAEAQRQGCITDALEAARDGAKTMRALLDALHSISRTGIEGIDRTGIDRTGIDRTGIDWPRIDRPRIDRTAVERMGDPPDVVPPGARERATTDGPDAAAAATAALASDGRPRGRLLVLDDDEKLLRMMSGFLEHAGFEVSATSEPSECVARYRERMTERRGFDLVILDLTIDDGRPGLTTLAALQAIDPDVRAVAHSGQAYADAMTAPRAHGFLAAIQKPTPLSALAATIDALLRAAD